MRTTKTRINFFPPVCFPAQNQVNIKKNRSSLRFSPVFGPKLGESPKKRSSPTVCALKPSTRVKKGGPCLNFAYYSMHIILSWRPKGGGHGPNPPSKYAPGLRTESMRTLEQSYLSLNCLRSAPRSHLPSTKQNFICALIPVRLIAEDS